jgi:peptidoglycan/xylan/chitin deacetylase (PgdA/CDA1 family)
MSGTQIQQLDDSGIVEIGSHTVNHADLTKLQPSLLDIQLQASKGSLEQLLRHPVVAFCYPSGRLNAQVVAAVAAAGYETATTEVPGTEHGWPDRLTWTRVRVDGGERLGEFMARLRTPEPANASTVRVPTAVPGPSGPPVLP